jgi:23S rRNA (cytidine1920-2'-O)/16S rRNA (cytidine1409-2'-O)-methyltransferase
VDPAGRECLDVGASTGGFTDVLLQRGAAHVVAVDVGRGQLAWKLRQDPRVTSLERTDIRRLAPLDQAPDLAVVDVAFISLRLVLPAIAPHLAPGADVVALVKPQFEAGRAAVGRGGVVRDPAVHAAVAAELGAWAATNGWRVLARVESPITGADGNREWLLHLRRADTAVPPAPPAGSGPAAEGG